MRPAEVRRSLLALLAVFVLLAGACGGGGDPVAGISLDGTPRVPDDEGVVTAISFESITLDDARTYGVSKNLKAFSTVTLELEPMLVRDGQYVQIGVKKGKMVWMAGIAQVVPTEPPTVYYTGTIDGVKSSERSVVFRDGTVLRLADGYEPPVTEGAVVVKIDPVAHRIVDLKPQR
ncbi:MAG: hypothetical protein ACR2H3_02755 [Acidimicrobiales bacterium]